MPKSLLDVMPTVPVRVHVASFPRRGHPIAPWALAPFLTGKSSVIPGSEIRGADSYLYLSELDASFWEASAGLSVEDAARLVELQVAREGYAVLSHIGSWTLDAVGSATALGPLTLSAATYESMAAANLFDSRRRLLSSKFERVIRLPGFGPRCLVDLLVGLEMWGHGIRVAELPTGPVVQLCDDIHERLTDRPSPCLGDPRFESVIGPLPHLIMDSRVCTLPQLIDKIPGRLRLLNDERIAQLEKLLLRLRDSLDEAQTMSIEEELDEVANAIARDARRKEMFIARHGLDGSEPQTLDSVGSSYGVSRERVRQILKRPEAKLRALVLSQERACPAVYAPRLDSALDLVRSRDLLSIEAPEALRAEGLSEGLFSMESLVEAAALFGRETEDLDDTDELAVLVRRVALRITSERGALTLTSLAGQLEARFGLSVAEDTIRKLVDADESAFWLDEDAGWLWIPSAKRQRCLNRARKALCVAESLSFQELRDAIRRDPRMANYSPPSDILRAICSSVDWAIVDGDSVRPLGLLPGHCLEGTELGVVSILLELGPVMSVQDLWSLAEARGHSRVRFWQVVINSPCIVRYERSIYGLRGRPVSALEVYELVSQLASLRPEGWVARDFGRIDETTAWFVFRLSANTLIRGSLPIPTGFRAELQGSYSLVDDQGTPVGSLTASARTIDGMGPVFRLWNVEADDWLLLLVETQARVITAVVGGMELVSERIEGFADDAQAT